MVSLSGANIVKTCSNIQKAGVNRTYSTAIASTRSNLARNTVNIFFLLEEQKTRMIRLFCSASEQKVLRKARNIARSISLAMINYKTESIVMTATMSRIRKFAILKTLFTTIQLYRMRSCRNAMLMLDMISIESSVTFIT